MKWGRSRDAEPMTYEPLVTYNVREVKRFGGMQNILVCARCNNEVEAKPNDSYWLRDNHDEPSMIPRHNYCPWCSAPLREVD